MCTTFPTGETNRLFVAERGGTIQVVTNLSTTPVKTQYLALTSLLATGETLRTDGENGFLSLVLHPNFTTNGRCLSISASRLWRGEQSAFSAITQSRGDQSLGHDSDDRFAHPNAHDS
jgi:hypothetical protein